MDFQNRIGSKHGGGGVMSEAQQNVARRERLRKLALETIDLSKDPYFMKNHLGTYECKLCLTVHANEGSYLAHTQGKKHQSNLGRRAAKEAAARPTVALPSTSNPYGKRAAIKIGRPGFRATKVRDPNTDQFGLLFQIEYPEIADKSAPLHRFMSAYEQKVDAPDRNYQYLLFAAEPYETIAFKLESKEVDKGEGRMLSNWDSDEKTYTFQFFFKHQQQFQQPQPPVLQQAPPQQLLPPVFFDSMQTQ